MKYLKKYNENYFGGAYTKLSEEDIDPLMIDLYDMLGDYKIHKGTYFNDPCYYIEFNHKLNINDDVPNNEYLELMGYLNVLKNRLNDLRLKIKFSIINPVDDDDDDLEGEIIDDDDMDDGYDISKKYVKIIIY